jgi:hypothetical protein
MMSHMKGKTQIESYKLIETKDVLCLGKALNNAYYLKLRHVSAFKGSLSGIITMVKTSVDKCNMVYRYKIMHRNCKIIYNNIDTKDVKYIRLTLATIQIFKILVCWCPATQAG